jgi:hypothetical protein
MTVGHARRIIRKQITEFCDAARGCTEHAPPGTQHPTQEQMDAQVVYWLTAAVYWWGVHRDPFARAHAIGVEVTK